MQRPDAKQGWEAKNLQGSQKEEQGRSGDYGEVGFRNSHFLSSHVRYSGFLKEDTYGPPEVDRIWVWVGYMGIFYNMPNAIFYSLKGGYMLLVILICVSRSATICII